MGLDPNRWHQYSAVFSCSGLQHACCICKLFFSSVCSLSCGHDLTLHREKDAGMLGSLSAYVQPLFLADSSRQKMRSIRLALFLAVREYRPDCDSIAHMSISLDSSCWYKFAGLANRIMKKLVYQPVLPHGLVKDI